MFPYLNLSVSPSAGAGVVWYGLDTGGQEDVRATHLGCPVIWGNKFAALKLIITKGQWDTVKCARTMAKSIPPLGQR